MEVLVEPGPKRGRPRLAPWGDWNGIPPGTLRRRTGVLPLAYMLWDLEWDDVGDAIAEPHRGLLCSVEKVAEVGVLNSLGETGRYA